MTLLSNGSLEQQWQYHFRASLYGHFINQKSLVKRSYPNDTFGVMPQFVIAAPICNNGSPYL